MESQGQASGRCIFLLLIEVQAIASHALISGPYQFLKLQYNECVRFSGFQRWKEGFQANSAILG